TSGVATKDEPEDTKDEPEDTKDESEDTRDGSERDDNNDSQVSNCARIESTPSVNALHSCSLLVRNSSQTCLPFATPVFLNAPVSAIALPSSIVTLLSNMAFLLSNTTFLPFNPDISLFNSFNSNTSPTTASTWFSAMCRLSVARVKLLGHR